MIDVPRPQQTVVEKVFINARKVLADVVFMLLIAALATWYLLGLTDSKRQWRLPTIEFGQFCRSTSPSRHKLFRIG